MDRDDFRRLTRRPALRAAFESVASREPPGRSELADALADAGLAEHRIDETVDQLAKVARSVHAGQKRFHALQDLHELAVEAIRRDEREDSLLGDELPEDDDAEDADAIAQAALGQRRDGIARRGKPPTSDSYSPSRVPWSQ